MPWKSSSVMDERIKFVIRASCKGVNISALCQDFGISRPTGYHWLKRYRAIGSLSCLGDLSRRPRHVPNRTPETGLGDPSDDSSLDESRLGSRFSLSVNRGPLNRYLRNSPAPQAGAPPDPVVKVFVQRKCINSPIIIDGLSKIFFGTIQTLRQMWPPPASRA